MATNEATTAAHVLASMAANEESVVVPITHTNKKWSQRKIDHLISVMEAIRKRLRKGQVMPCSYMKSACELFRKRYRSFNNRVISRKWRQLVDHKTALPVVADCTVSLPATPPQVVPLKRKHTWSPEEIEIFEDVVVGEDGLLNKSPGTYICYMIHTCRLHLIFTYSPSAKECLASCVSSVQPSRSSTHVRGMQTNVEELC